MTVQWPSVLVPRSVTGPELRGAAISGGRATSGDEQRVYSDAGRWEVSYTVPIRTRAQALAWRSMTARLRAGEDILLTVYDRWRPQAVIAGDTLAEMHVSAGARATAVTLGTMGFPVEEGLHFCIYGDRLYRITGVGAQSELTIGLAAAVSEDELWDDGDVWVDDPMILSETTILPPLRSAIPAGTAVGFRDLVLRAVLADLSAGDLDLDLGRFGDPTITFREA